MNNVNYGPGAVARENEILRSVVGSGVHGIAIEGTDDHDEMGIFVEPREYVYGLRGWNYRSDIPTWGADTPIDRHLFRTQPEGERSGPGDIDLVLYSLRKYLRLACQGNPTALLPLYAPEESVVVSTPLGVELRNMRETFLSRRALRRFVGYLDSQHERMLGGGKRNRVPARPELVERYGYDTKYASHALRLSYQGYEIAATGTLTLPMSEDPRAHVLGVKQGQYDIEHVSRQIDLNRRCIISLMEASNPVGPWMRENPDWEAISAWSMLAHERHWFSR